MSTAKTEIPLVIRNPQIDFELSELLGEKPEDFINICADGQQVPFFGTPFDSPRERKNWQAVVDSLNDRSRKSRWPEVFNGRFVEFARHYNLPVTTTHKEFHPTFSLQIKRVSAGYSEHLNVAIGIFDKIRDKVKDWNVGMGGDIAFVTIIGKSGTVTLEQGASLPLTITKSVVYFLRAVNAEKQKEGA